MQIPKSGGASALLNYSPKSPSILFAGQRSFLQSPARLLLLGAALTAAVPSSALADVVPFLWAREGEGAGFLSDSSGNARNFVEAYSGSPGVFGGIPGVLTGSFSVGGPLGKTGQSSTAAARWGAYNRTAAVKKTAAQVFPAVDYVLEAWIFPLGTGSAAYNYSNPGQIAGIGAGHLAFQSSYDLGNPWEGIPGSVGVRLIAGGASVTPLVPVSSTTWTHLAAVNRAGILTFHINGESQGEPVEYAQAGNGQFALGGNNDAWNAFNGYIDEVRFSTFAEGQFELADLLTVPPSGPVLIRQPQAATVHEGGTIRLGLDSRRHGTPEYQWRKGAEADPVKEPVAGAAERDLVISGASAANTGVYSAAVTQNGETVVSNYAAVQLAVEDPLKTGVYRAGVEAESSLFAYFPSDDGGAGATQNTKQAGLPAQLLIRAGYDGQANRSLGTQALHFHGPLDGGSLVRLPNEAEILDPGVTITPEETTARLAALQAARFEREDDGLSTLAPGTIEALVYISPDAPAVGAATIYSVAGYADSVAGQELAFAAQADFAGTSLYFQTPSSTVTWTVPAGIRGRLAHVAFTLSPETITAYVDGQSLGAQPRPLPPPFSTHQVNIGSSGANGSGLIHYPWQGTIDELALYGEELSSVTIASHYARFAYGIKLRPPAITVLTHEHIQFTIPNGAGRQLNAASLQVTRAGTPVAVTHSTVDGVTTFSYQASGPAGFFPGGTQAFEFVYQDNTGESYQFTRSAAVPAYTHLPPALVQPAASAGTSGFSARVFQTLPAGNATNLGLWAVAEGVLDGVAGAPYAAEGNLIQPAGAVNGRFHLETINLEQEGLSSGSFSGDALFPGIPGKTSSNDYFVFEGLAWVHFPAAGFYTLGVDSDDGFRVNYGHKAVPALEIVSPATAARAVAVTPSTPQTTATPVGIAYPNPPVTAKLVLAEPITGFPTITNGAALNGNIAVVQRGDSTFLDKAQQAHAAGAVGILVLNNLANQTLIAPVSTGAAGSVVPIPYGHVSYSDGEALKTLIQSHPEGVQASFGVESHRILAQTETVANTTFRVLVTEPGLYPLRIAGVELTGGARLEWFSVDESGNRHLINDAGDPDSLKAYAALAVPGSGPSIQIVRNSAGDWVIEYSGILQSTPDLGSPFVDVTGATSPYTIPTAAAPARFYRARP